ncbi:MAG: ABC transporter permease [Bauldia sp.]
MVDRTVADAPPRKIRFRIRGGSWSLWLVGLLVFLAIFGPLIVPYDPLATNAQADFQPPSFAHLFGTDDVGRDVFSRVIVATRLDLLIALGAVLLSLGAGVALGAMAGWAGGWPDRIVSRLVDTIMGFPLFVLAVGIAAGMGNSVWSVVIATAVVNLPLYARTTRSEVNKRRNAGFVQAARLSGIRPLKIVALHILPNIAPILAVQCSLNVGWAILNAAGLSFIGLGIRPPTPEWGIMVADGAEYLYSGEWWLFLFPGLVLVLSVLAFAGLGDYLRDRLDPKRA